MENLTVTDTLGILKASLALLPFMLAPGYIIGYALDLFEFRRRRAILRLVVALPLSIALCPMLSYLLARFFETGLWIFYFAVFAASAFCLFNGARRLSKYRISNYNRIALGVAALWVVIAFGSIVDLQIGDKLYPPTAAFDHSIRAAMTVAIAREVPPSNPFFANASAPLRYHYLWLLFCSLPMKIFHLTPRYVVYAGVVWCGLGLMCTIAVGLKFLVRVQTEIERKTLLAVCLLSITGLDILPTLYFGLARHFWVADMEWWNDVQISSWADCLVFVPHHIAALIACFIAFMLLRHQVDNHLSWATRTVITAGMAFASSAGMSVYVTFTFVVAIALWMLVLIVRRNWLELSMFAASGVVALLWAVSFLAGLRGPASGAAFVELSLRPFPLGFYLIREIGIIVKTQIGVTLANAIFLPLNYGLELGFFLVVGIIRLRQLLRRTTDLTTNELAAWTFVITSFLVGTFLRSSTISSNDLGWRCFLPAQLVLLLWGATIIDDWWFHTSHVTPQSVIPLSLRALLATMLVIGICSTAYQVCMLRIFPILVDRGEIGRAETWVTMDRQFGERAFALRSAYDALNTQLPSSAIVQTNPGTKDPVLHVLYSGHDAAAADGKCGTDFGGDPSVCAVRTRALTALFSRFPDGDSLDSTCSEFAIDAVVVEDLDPAWKDSTSWVWSRQPIVANSYVRAFRCGQRAISLYR